MWGRISNLAEKIDANFGVDDAENTNEELQEEDDEDVEEEGDGWGDDDDVGFGDELDLNDTSSEVLTSNNDSGHDDAPNYNNSINNVGNPAIVEAPTVVLPPESITVSAPGKALIAGGYLVLEPHNPGLVLAAEGCRFHTTVMFRPIYSGCDETSSDANNISLFHSIPLDVYSPQFDRVFSYNLFYSSQNGIEVSDTLACLRLTPRKTVGPQEPNKFVERSLLLALGYLHQSMGAELFHSRLQQLQQPQKIQYKEILDGTDGGGELALALKLRADNDFYSQIIRLRERGFDLTPQNLARLEPFLPCPKDEVTGELIVNKTGMGSSAALVTSIVGALLTFFGVISLPETDGGKLNLANTVNEDGEMEKNGLRITHNLAQICHCHAQGKVGSGFDVSAAVYGSHVYTRFSETLIDEFLGNVASSSNAEEGGLQLISKLSLQLATLVNDVEWDCTMNPVSLPQGLELLMADVCGGSESPSMARNILEWKKKKRKVGFMDDYYWKDLKRCNKRVISLLSDQFSAQTFLDGLRRDGAMIISTRTAEQWKKPMPSSWHLFDGSSWDVALKLLDLRMALLECRQNLKGMGVSAGVPVEPDVQSAIADTTMKLPGVVAAGVPGAGGYDALFVIYVKGPATFDGQSDQVRDAIGKLWREMSEASNDRVICPLSVRAAGIGHGLCSTNLEW